MTSCNEVGGGLRVAEKGGEGSDASVEGKWSNCWFCVMRREGGVNG